MWLRGSFYSFLAILHAITVIAALLYLAVRQVLPHLPAARAARRQALSEARAKQVRAQLARAAASASPRGCTSTILKRVLPQLGFDYAMAGPVGQLAGTLPGLQTQVTFAGATETEGGSAWLRLRSPKRRSKNSSDRI